MKQGVVGFITGIVCVAALLASSAPTTALGWFGAGRAEPAVSSGAEYSATADACLHYTNHEYEVCTAYIYNSSLVDLVPYYKYVHSSNDSLSSFVSYRLGSRYTGQAYSVIANRVASWPMGASEVSVPKIEILSVHSSLATNTATLVTKESWTIRTESGYLVYKERGVYHTITMHRVQSYVLHKWVVTNIN